MLNSLSNKITITVTAIIFLTVASLFAVAYYSIEKAVSNQMREDGVASAYLVASGVERIGMNDVKRLQSYVDEIKIESHGTLIYAGVMDPSFRLIAASSYEFIDKIIPTEEGRQAFSEGKPKAVIMDTPEILESYGSPVFNISMPIHNGDKIVGLTVIAISLQNMYAAIHSTVVLTLAVSALILILSIMLAFTFSRRITRPILTVIDGLNQIAAGDMTVRVPVTSRDELGMLASTSNKSNARLQNMLISVQQEAGEVKKSSASVVAASQKIRDSNHQLSVATQDVANQAQEQADSVSNAVDLMNHLDSNMSHINQQMGLLSEGTGRVGGLATAGSENLQQVSQYLKQIQNNFLLASDKNSQLFSRIQDINTFADIIKSIANQTNLLALNASIEAARAGEHGRGFSVVADEIRKLAEGSLDSSRKIQIVMEQIGVETRDVLATQQQVGEQTNQQFHMVSDVVQSFGQIFHEIQTIAPIITETLQSVDSSTQAQQSVAGRFQLLAEAASQISAASEEIAALLQDQTESSYHLTDTSSALSVIADEMITAAGQFRVM
ncbi:methyl-accepting chemotaxis protein [Pelosinus sp. sgz500959]|uniref:methyl-accepting chemotaxis protein n=1 Tax=Pelosinus sp. sgz500959 TaxID=3242472 RepID=UPI0036711EFD